MPPRPFVACVLGVMLLTACGLGPRGPEPLPPQWTPIVEFPTILPPTPTALPRLKPIFEDDLLEARNTLLIIQTGLAAGDTSLLAERVMYPIDVLVEGSTMTISSPGQFQQYFWGIFPEGMQQQIRDADAEDLVQLPDGVKAAGGILWFNQFCIDAACTQGRFLITRINN